MRISLRLKPEAASYFESKMAEWHLNPTDTLHKLLAEYQSLEKDNKTLRDYLDLRFPQPSETQLCQPCPRGVKFHPSQKQIACDSVCRIKYPDYYQKCQKS